MAVKATTNLPDANVNFRRTAWLGLANGDSGAPLDNCDFQDRTVQITGVFGAGGSCAIQGSNDGGVTWSTLTDPLGAPLVFTSAGIKMITELPYAIRPAVTAGDGATAINVYLLQRGDRH
jgi:hypothetical protein